MEHNLKNSLKNQPDENGHFGIFGGRYVAETLMPLILDVEQAYLKAKDDPTYIAEFDELNRDYIGRPSPLYFAKKTTELLGGAKIYFKRDELNHTGSHKINNCIGQILLARRMGKTRIIAETGAGQHGVATATVCALFGMPCTIFMGATDIERQKPNVFRMKLLGADVRAVTAGAGTLKDAMNEALRYWVANVHDTYYIIGTAAGPHPYPMMVRDFQSIIGRETKQQILEREGRLPDACVACIGGGSNAIGLFHPFIDDRDVHLIGVEAGGHGVRHRTGVCLADPALDIVALVGKGQECCPGIGRIGALGDEAAIDEALDQPRQTRLAEHHVTTEFTEALRLGALGQRVENVVFVN